MAKNKYHDPRIDYSKITHLYVDGAMRKLPSLEEWPMCTVKKCLNRVWKNADVEDIKQAKYCFTHTPCDFDEEIFEPCDSYDDWGNSDY